MGPKRSMIPAAASPYADQSERQTDAALAVEMSLLASGEHSDPHRLLGVRRTGNDILIRALCPGSMGVSLIVDGMPKPIEMSRLHPIGIYEANLV
ncbi:MAG: hypothetical protein ABR507_03860, partial [Actinomycetota bacterium]